jgi:endosialidase-like protein
VAFGYGSSAAFTEQVRIKGNGNVLARGALFADFGNTNDGTYTPGYILGTSGSGESIASKRTAGGNQFGLDFYTNFTNRMSITNTGGVGIGLTTPSTTLDVVDAAGGGHIQIGLVNGGAPENVIRFGDINCTPGQCVGIGESETEDRLVFYGGRYRFNKVEGAADEGTGNVEPGTDAVQSLGSATNRWSAVYAANGAIQTSDGRLKTGVAQLRYGLAEVMQMRPVSFQWKGRADERTYLGLIAQEVETVVPEAVEHDTDPDTPLGMNYSALVPVLIKAVQEERAEHTARIVAVEAENAVLKQRLADVEQALQQLLTDRRDEAAASHRQP